MNIDILENQLELGQVKTIRSSGGTKLDYVELLFNENTQVQFAVNRETNKVEMSMNNTDLKYQDLNCNLDKSTLRDFIMSLKDVYKELESEAK